MIEITSAVLALFPNAEFTIDRNGEVLVALGVDAFNNPLPGL